MARTRDGVVTRYLAEGATGAFFHTRLDLANPGAGPAIVLLRFLTDTGARIAHVVVIPPLSHTSFDPATIAGPGARDVLDGDRGGRHRRRRSHDVVGRVRLRQPRRDRRWPRRRRPGTSRRGRPRARSRCSICCRTRSRRRSTRRSATCGRWACRRSRRSTRCPRSAGTTIVVDGEGADLASTDVSAVITAASPIVAERAMYLSQPDQPFAAGHESAGVTAPGARVVPRRRRDRDVLRPLRADRQPERLGRDRRGRVPAGRRRLANQDLHGGRQLAVHDLGGRRAAAAGLGVAAVRQRVAVDGGAFDQRRADRRRADDVVAGPGADVELLVRGAQLTGRDDDRDALGAWRAGILAGPPTRGRSC